MIIRGKIIIHLCRIVFKLMNLLAQYMENNSGLLKPIRWIEYGSWVRIQVTAIIVRHFVARHSVSTTSDSYRSHFEPRMEPQTNKTTSNNAYIHTLFEISLNKSRFSFPVSSLCDGKTNWRITSLVRVLTTTQHKVKKNYLIIIEFTRNNLKTSRQRRISTKIFHFHKLPFGASQQGEAKKKFLRYPYE